MLAQCNTPDVLLAYQPAGPKIARFLKLIESYPSSHFSCLIDSVDAATAIAGEALNHGLYADVFLDINVGMNRTGLLPQNAVALYEACKNIKGINVIGLHGYDGHIADSDPEMRKQKADEAYQVLSGIKKAVEAIGLADPIVVIGGSPTFGIHAQRKNIECSPGTFVYWDRSYEELYPDLKFLPAVLLVTRVVSVINNKRVCLDLGHKSVAAENPLNRRIYFLNAKPYEVVGHSEEHLVIETADPHDYRVGDVFYGMPFHVCPTCALYNEALIIEEGRVKTVWEVVARRRSIGI